MCPDPRARKALETYIDLLCVAISVAVIWHSIQLMQIQQMANIRMHALPLNLSWAQAALPLGWALMIIRIAQRTARRFAPTPSAAGMIRTATSQGAVSHG